MWVYSFDPGATTGFCLLATEPGLRVTESRELVSWKDWGVLERCWIKPCVIVAESFHLFPGAAQHLINNVFPAAQKIGVIEYLAWKTDIRVVFQAPSIKKMFPDKELRVHLPGYVLPSSDHIRDALRHAVYYYFNNLWPKLKT